MTIANYPPPLFPGVLVDRFTEHFWAAAREHRLVVPVCSDCATMRMPPGPYCPRCRSPSFGWRALPGTGSIYTYTIVSRAIVPEMTGHLPYVPAVVNLDDAPGIRLISAIVECDIENVAIDAPVRVRWRRASDGQELPFFTLIGPILGAPSAAPEEERSNVRE